MVAIVDESNYENLARYKWYAHPGPRTFYARTNIPAGDGSYRGVFMHRMIVDIPEGYQTDHINGNGLDNRSVNLRACSRSENLRNRREYRGGTSTFKGVYWDKRDKKWVARIKKDGERYLLGRFCDEIQAARAYNAAAKKYHGEFARVNFVPVTG
jgi:hypothetical protein